MWRCVAAGLDGIVKVKQGRLGSSGCLMVWQERNVMVMLGVVRSVMARLKFWLDILRNMPYNDSRKEVK